MESSIIILRHGSHPHFPQRWFVIFYFFEPVFNLGLGSSPNTLSPNIELKIKVETSEKFFGHFCKKGMKLPHVNGSSESCHGSCDVPCLGSALRVRSAVRDCFQSRMIANARSRLAQHRCKVELCTIFALQRTENSEHIDEGTPIWWYLAWSPSPPPMFMTLVRSRSNIHNFSFSFSPHLEVSGMPTGREAAISSFLPPAPLLLQGMWIPSSASESWIQRDDNIADLNSFVNLSLVFRIGYGLGRPQVLLIESLVSICISTVGAKKGENGRAYRRSHLHPINEK